MRRSSVSCALLLFATLLTGCHRSMYDGLARDIGCQGCGKRYWGAYMDDPPRPEPCDCYGNWTGPCGGGNCECDRGAKRTARRAEHLNFLSARLNGPSWFGKGTCCEDGDCGECKQCSHEAAAPSCGKQSCSEPTCAEPGCGEPGCGCGHSSGGMSSEMMLDDMPAVPMPTTTSSSRSPQRKVQPVGRTTIVQAAASRSPSPGGCNCGKH